MDKSSSSRDPVRASFPTTHWSLILCAGVTGQDSIDALEYLYRIYLPAIHSYARRRGYSEEDAEDLTQGFFTKLMEKGYVRQADRERGKFRTFILSSFRNYLANEWDRSHARRRGGGQTPRSLDASDWQEATPPDPVDRRTPETVFIERWVGALLNQVFGRLRDDMTRSGEARRFDRLRPFLPGSTSDVGYREVAADLGTTESAVKAAVYRLRRRFGRLLRQEVAHTLTNPDDVADEIRFLIGVLAASHAHTGEKIR